jgi:hypothetical protein
MKRFISLLALYVAVLLCLGAASVNQIKFFTDYPNSAPVGSDFMLFQRNSTYVNATVSQALGVWFNNPAFTGSGSIVGNFNIGGTLTVGGAVITGVTYYGDGSGLSNVASQVYLKNLNDNGTNETFWGVTSFQELDVLNAYLTNTFTFLTNAQFLKTDGNGQVQMGVELPGTNVLLSAGANINFSTNGSGGIAISSSGTNSIDTITNNLFVTTNLIVYNSLTVVSNVYATTNFSTNLYFVSGKGNTLNVTNLYISAPGSLNNSNVTANTIATWGPAKDLTNGTTTADLNLTGNVLGITAGASPTLNLVNSTNLVYRYTTNALTAITMTFGKAYTTNVSSANIVFTAINAQDLAALETVCLFATNSGGTDRTITLPNGIGSPGLGLPPVITVTNKQSCWIYVQHYGALATNCWFIPSY